MSTLFVRAGALITLFVSLAITSNAVAQVMGPQLSDDQSDSCKALLCLASPKTPDECIPPLAKYFDIARRTWSETVNARRDFLKLCPNSSSSNEMESLTDALATGSGKCDVDSLNRMTKTVYKAVWIPATGSGDNDTGGYITSVPVDVINNQMPSYCAAYYGHAYTVALREAMPQYVGDPTVGSPVLSNVVTSMVSTDPGNGNNGNCYVSPEGGMVHGCYPTAVKNESRDDIGHWIKP